MPVFRHLIQPTLLRSDVYNEMPHFLLISFIILFAVSKIRTQFFGSKVAYEQMKIISTKGHFKEMKIIPFINFEKSRLLKHLDHLIY